MSERDYMAMAMALATETEVNERLRDLCKERGKRIAELEAEVLHENDLFIEWRAKAEGFETKLNAAEADKEDAVMLLLKAGLSTGHGDTCADLMDEVLGQFKVLKLSAYNYVERECKWTKQSLSMYGEYDLWGTSCGEDFAIIEEWDETPPKFCNNCGGKAVAA